MPVKNFVLLILLCSFSLVTTGQEVCPYTFPAKDKVNFDNGVSAYEKRHFPEANTLLRKVSSRHPRAADPYFYLGMIAATENTNPGAIRHYFTRLNEVCPDYPNALAHYYMGIIYYTDEKYEEAVAALNRYFDIANQKSIPSYVAVYEEASNYLYWSQFLAEATLNAVPFNPQVVYGASSKTDEILPYITWDGKHIYYLRKVSQRKEKTYYGKVLDELKPRLCVSRWRDTVFSTGEELPDPFNQGPPEGGVSITADNQLLYYSVWTQDKGTGNFDICFSERKGGVWQPVKDAGANVNNAKAWDSQPSISSDGQWLYFASNRPGGQGGTDIWRCHRLPNGDWSRAENLGPAVNTAGNEKCPFLHADGKTLYFASNGWQGFGGYDMYFINLNDTYLQRPTNMGMPINGDGDDICFGVMADGKKAYYADRAKDYNGVGGTDIFWFELYPDARPEAMKWIQVKSVAPQDPTVAKPVTLRVKRYGAPEACYTVTGQETAMMLSVSETNVVSAAAEGYMLHVQVLAKSDVQRMSHLDVRLSPLAVGGTYRLKGRLFDERSGKLTDTGRQMMDAYVPYLLDHPSLHIRLESMKTVEAKALYDYLISQKLRPDRLDYAGGTAYTQTQLVVTAL